MITSDLIGVFDSGVGGLSVAKEIKALMPDEEILYIGDQANNPYGPRSKEEIITFSVKITDHLIQAGAKIIVVACNTASAAALSFLRETYPFISFVGMEPAIKPASQNTKTGVIGVLATPNTFEGELYTNTVRRFAEDKLVMEDPCVGLVERIEGGELSSTLTKDILNNALAPMIAAGVDSVVLGCTHYPFVLPLIKDIVGESVEVINPAPAVAKQVQTVLNREGRALVPSGHVGKMILLTTGNEEKFHHTLKRISPEILEGAEVGALQWIDGDLV